MGLKFVDDLAAWQRWQDRRQPVTSRFRRMLRVRRGSGEEPCVLLTGSASPRVVTVLDALNPTSVASLLAPVHHLDPDAVAVIAPADCVAHLPDHPWARSDGTTKEALAKVLQSAGVIAAVGHFLPRGGYAHQCAAERSDLHFATVQHGIVTPHTPPLARSTHLLAWSGEDATFWRSQRDDVHAQIVGSQLLWAASQDPVKPAATNAQSPTFLGQLHGAELDFRSASESARDFCISNGAIYRPHPAETDRRSSRVQRKWAAEGIEIDRSRRPLNQLRGPVVSAFSTGILEAAAMGLPAWAHHKDPPPWLSEVWLRYSMSRWERDAPTLPPSFAPNPPAQEVAHALLRLAT